MIYSFLIITIFFAQQLHAAQEAPTHSLTQTKADSQLLFKALYKLNDEIQSFTFQYQQKYKIPFESLPREQQTTFLKNYVHKGELLIEQYIADEGDVNTEDQEYHISVLRLAILLNLTDGTKLLIKHGAHVNVIKRDGDTLLLLATRSGDLPLIQFLLAHGAQVDRQNAQGTTALMFAINNHHRRDIEGYEKIVADIVEALIRAKAQINLQDNHGITALMEAARKNYPVVVLQLLLAGADTTLRARITVEKISPEGLKSSETMGKTFYDFAQGKPAIQEAIKRYENYKIAKPGVERIFNRIASIPGHMISQYLTPYGPRGAPADKPAPQGNKKRKLEEATEPTATCPA